MEDRNKHTDVDSGHSEDSRRQRHRWGVSPPSAAKAKKRYRLFEKRLDDLCVCSLLLMHCPAAGFLARGYADVSSSLQAFFLKSSIGTFLLHGNDLFRGIASRNETRWNKSLHQASFGSGDHNCDTRGALITVVFEKDDFSQNRHDREAACQRTHWRRLSGWWRWANCKERRKGG